MFKMGDVYSVYYRVVGDSTSLGSGMIFSNAGCGTQPLGGTLLVEAKHGVSHTFTTAVEYVRITDFTVLLILC
jgi:hypothetical protein